MSASSEDDRPRSDVYDLGVIELAARSEETNGFRMPYDGYIRRVGPSWPPGSNNAIGFALRAARPNVDPSKISDEVKQYVRDVGYFLPANHPNPQYITDDNTFIPFYPYRYVPQGVRIESEIENASVNNALDLQVRVSITNFDPREVDGAASAGRRG